MGIKKYFDISRFWLLIKVEIFKSRKGIMMTFVITFGMLFLIGLLLSPAVEPNLMVYEHTTSYIFALLAGGFILSSLAFNDLSSTLKRYHYLTLPVSIFERFFCMWLLTSIGWIILFTITYTLYTLIANIIGSILFSQVKFLSFKPWDDFVIHSMRIYFVVQGVFLVGAAKFKGYVFPKTLFTLIIFAIVAGFLAYFFLADMTDMDAEYLNNLNVWMGMSVFKILLVLKWVFWWLFAPLCWVITYLSLKEKEV